MTPEQSKQYEICKIRRHEEPPPGPPQSPSAHSMQAYNPWKRCRWCGTEYQEVQETRQVERTSEPSGPQRELHPRGTVYEASVNGSFCRHCGEVYDRHKAYPRGECPDGVRQG